MKFNMLLDYCVGRAATSVKEFYILQVAEICQDRDLSNDSMVIGTSAIIDTEIDGAHAGRFFANLQKEINYL